MRTSLFYNNPRDVSEVTVDMTEASNTAWPSQDFSTLLGSSIGRSLLLMLDAESLQNLSLTSKSAFSTTQRHILTCSVEQRISLLSYARAQLLKCMNHRASQHHAMFRRRILYIGIAYRMVMLAIIAWEMLNIRLGKNPTLAKPVIAVSVAAILSLSAITVALRLGHFTDADIEIITDRIVLCRTLQLHDFDSYPTAIKATVLGALQHTPGDADTARRGFDIRDNSVWLTLHSGSQQRACAFEIEQLLADGQMQWQQHLRERESNALSAANS